MPRNFPFYPQLDAMDCGPACLMKASAFYGKKVPLPFLREKSHYGRAGVSAQGIENAAEAIGFRSMTVKIPFLGNKDSACLLNAPLPCIAHWNQNHFVVVHKLTEKMAWVADPGSGKVKIPRAVFEKSWKNGSEQGIAILLEPTPTFYQKEIVATTPRTAFSLIFDYLRPHRRLIMQLFIGMLVGSGLQMVFPFLTQSIVDSGIANRNIGFIYLILAAQLMLFIGQITVQFVQTRILLFIGTRINVAKVNDFLAKLTRLRLGFFDAKMTGDLMQRIGDQSRIESFLTQSGTELLKNFLKLSGAL